MKRIIHSFTQTNVSNPEHVFPLLCPVREADWVPGWKYRLVYSNSGFGELGCVFTTPNEDGSETTWIVTEYDPPFHIAFAWVWPGMIATRLEIHLESEGEKKTRAQITYQYTALTTAGERLLETYNDQWFASKMQHWESAINGYLATGKMASVSEWG